MRVGKVGNPIDIAVSGMKAESVRMNVITGNIASANISRTASGQPYRRRHVVMASAPDGSMGVKVEKVVQDTTTDFKTVYEPGHPDADKEGYVRMPNVDLPVEMMHLVAASRAYQANAAVLKRHLEIGELSLELLR